MKDFKVGIIQINSKTDKRENLNKMENMVRDLTKNGADVVALPEMWNSPYQYEYYKKFSEEDFGETYHAMSRAAKENNIYLVGGSIPIRDENKIYNRSYVFNRDGKEIYRYSKINLFDIEGFKESSTISAGKTLGAFHTEFGIFGLAICFDLRFPEIFQRLTEMGSEVIFVPSAFSYKTGKRDLELLNRARAVDTQCYFISPSIARDDELSKHTFSHSFVISPHGEVLLDLGEEEKTEIVDILASEVQRERKFIPLKKSRKNRSL